MGIKKYFLGFGEEFLYSIAEVEVDLDIEKMKRDAMKKKRFVTSWLVKQTARETVDVFNAYINGENRYVLELSFTAKVDSILGFIVINASILFAILSGRTQ